MSLPSVVLVGRPNVGKSTLFNRLCETRKALMSDVAGTTRDWQEGRAHWNGREYRVIDTGGYAPGDDDVLTGVRQQVERWVKEADLTLWLVDGGEGLSPADQTLGGWMRSRARNVLIVVNKVDDAPRERNVAEFHRLGFDVIPVSASHGRHVHALLDAMEEHCPVPQAPDPALEGVPAVALVGRPNVGKSSTLNALLGEQRMIVSAVPGTTRDAVDTLVEKDGRKLLFIDTAGLRASKSKSAQGLEGLTRIMSEKALDRADVAVLLIDGAEGVCEGDIAVGRLIDVKGRGCVVAINKWDLVKDRHETARRYREDHSRELPFLAYAPIVFTSAKTGHHIPELLDLVTATYDASRRTYDNEELTAFFWRLVQERPYSHDGRKLVFHRAEQVSSAPTTIVLWANMTQDDVHFSFLRRLENEFRARYDLQGAPLFLRFKWGKR
jgi:GTPase